MIVRFDGRVVAVTGGASGFGRAISQRFAALGARVFTCDRDEANLADTAADSGIETRVIDLRDRSAAAGWISDIERETAAPVDVLVHNAGGILGQSWHPIEEVSNEAWDDIIAVNLHAAFALCRAAVPSMRAAGRGRIVQITSTAGLRPSRTGIQAYTSAKHGLVGLTRQLAAELGRSGITVNSVAPGLVPSTPEKEQSWRIRDATDRKALLSELSLGRLAQVEEIANAVLFLASDYASGINGHVIPVNGGRL